MDLDDLLVRFFGSDDLTKLSEAEMVAGADRLRLQFGLERDRGRRFALWSLLYLLGLAPELNVAFGEEEDREAAREFMDMADQELNEP